MVADASSHEAAQPRARFWIIQAIVLLSVMYALFLAWIASPLWL